MEGFGNYDPDADEQRVAGVVERGVAALANLGDYVPDTWKNKLKLYEIPVGTKGGPTFGAAASSDIPYTNSARVAPNRSLPTFAGEQTYSSGSFNFASSPCKTPPPPTAPPVGYPGDVFMKNLPANGAFTQIGSGDRGHRSQLGAHSPKIISPVLVGEYESRLVKRIVQPRGGRTQPTPTELNTFKADVSGLDMAAVLKSLQSYICDAELTWQWKIRALAVVQSLLTESTQSVRVREWLQTNPEVLATMHKLHQKQCDMLVKSISQALGECPSGATSPPPSARLIDLLDDDDGGEDEKHSAPAAAPAPPQPQSLLDDLLS